MLTSCSVPRLLAPLLLGLSLSACAPDAPAPDPEEAQVTEAQEPEAEAGRRAAFWEMPSYAERVLSNSFVSVYRYTLAPNDTLSMQEGTKWVVYAPAGAALVEGENAFALAPNAARLFTSPGVLHNAGADTTRLVLFERTENDLPDRITEANAGRFLPDEALDLDQVGGDAVQILVAEHDVLVSRLTLQSGDTLPLQSGFSRVIYALSDYTVQRFGAQGFGGAGGDMIASRKAGDAVWNTASNFAAENVGDSAVEALVVAYYK